MGAAWLNTGSVARLVLIMTGRDTKETVERWEFSVRAQIASPGAQ